MSRSEHIVRVCRLYKLIFRVHRALPAELRVMGNNYARDEFKRHKNCNPEEARIFLNEWTEYAIRLAKQMKPMNQAKEKVVGAPLDPSLLDHMTEEQLVQLYELHKAASEEPAPAASDVTADNEPRLDIQFNDKYVTKIEYCKKGDDTGKEKQADGAGGEISNKRTE